MSVHISWKSYVGSQACCSPACTSSAALTKPSNIISSRIWNQCNKLSWVLEDEFRLIQYFWWIHWNVPELPRPPASLRPKDVTSLGLRQDWFFFQQIRWCTSCVCPWLLRNSAGNIIRTSNCRIVLILVSWLQHGGFVIPSASAHNSMSIRTQRDSIPDELIARYVAGAGLTFTYIEPKLRLRIGIFPNRISSHSSRVFPSCSVLQQKHQLLQISNS